MNLAFVGAIALAVVIIGLIFWLGYSAGESDTNRKILAHQQQTEAAQRWKEVLEKMNERGLV